jgi:hypothetical protein
VRRLVLALVFALGACGGGGTGPDGAGGAGVRARIDGAQWTANVGYAAVNGDVGMYVITALGSLNNYTLTFILENITGPGTYPLGVYSTMFGGYASLTDTGDSWTNPFTGNAGQIVITELTATRMVGTFQFVVEADAGTAPSTHTITEGEFDVPVTGPYGVATAGMGSSFTANVGTPFFVNQVAHALSSGNLIIQAYSDDGIITISMTGFTQTTGTIAYPTQTTVPVRTIALGQSSGGWGTQGTGGSGTVNLTVTADRFSGTFTATVVPTGSGAVGTRSISGTFSIGRAP